VSTTGLQGALGFWYAGSSAHLTYTVKTTWGAFGPYDIAPSIGAAGNPASPGGAQQYANLAGNSFFADPSTLNALIYNVSNNGIALSLAECLHYSYACQVLAPAIYAQTEAMPWGGPMQPQLYGFWPLGTPSTVTPGTSFTDMRQGGPEWMGTPAPAPSWVGSNYQGYSMGPQFSMIQTWAPPRQFALPAPALRVAKANLYGTRFSAGNIGDEVEDSALQLWYIGDAPASANSLQLISAFNSNGDAIAVYNENSVRGQIGGGDSEGHEQQRNKSYEAADVFQGTINTITALSTGTSPCTAPCTVLNTTQTQGWAGDLGVFLPVVDVTRAYSTGYITSIAGPAVTANSAANWDTQFGVSNAYGVLTQAISNASGGSTTLNTFPQTNVTVSITTTFGTWNTTLPVCISDSDTGLTWECDKITAESNTSLTFTVVTLPHNANITISQGGMAGMGLRMSIDCVGPGNLQGFPGDDIGGPFNTICPTYPVMYNTTGNVAHMISGVRSSFYTRGYSFMGTGGTVTATVAGGVVTACTASGGTGYSPYSDPNNGYMNAPPQLSYTVNAGGTPPVLALGPNGAGALGACTVVNPGASLTSVTVAVTPTNGYSVLPMARAQNVWNPTTGNVDGSSIALDAGGGLSQFQVGDTVEQEHGYAMTFTAAVNAMAHYEPGGSLNGEETNFGGQFGTNEYAKWMINNNQPNLYNSYPAGATPWILGKGLMGTPNGYTLSGSWLNDLYAFMPPYGTSGSVGVVSVGCLDDVNQVYNCSTWKEPYNMLTAQNSSAGGYDVLQYSIPLKSWTLTAGGTGGSGAGATGTMTLSPAEFSETAPGFNMSGFAYGLMSNLAPNSGNPAAGTWVPTNVTLSSGTGGPLGLPVTEIVGTAGWLLADNYSSEPLTANTTYSGGGFFYAASSQTIAFLVGAGGPFQYCAIGPEWDWCPISVNTGPTPGNTILLLKGINTGVSDTFYTAGVSVFLPGQSAGYYATGGTPVSVPAPNFSVPLAQNGSAMTPSSVSINGSTPAVTTINGGGTALPSTSDTTTTTGHVVTEQNTTGKYGDSGIAITSLAPLYTTAGITITSPHQVFFSGTLATGTLAITLSGSAVYTSTTSYFCSAGDSTTPANVVTVTYTSATAFTLTGTGTDAVRGTCTGN
jgi:hypothetical protein